VICFDVTHVHAKHTIEQGKLHCEARHAYRPLRNLHILVFTRSKSNRRSYGQKQLFWAFSHPWSLISNHRNMARWGTFQSLQKLNRIILRDEPTGIHLYAWPVLKQYPPRLPGAGFFCRTMLCISAAYDAVRCLSIWVSVMFAYCVETSRHILKLFHHSGLSLQTLWRYSDWDPRNGGDKCRGHEKVASFDQYLALSRKWYKIGP